VPPPLENFSIADLKNGEFWCILCGVFEFRSICQHLGIHLYY